MKRLIIGLVRLYQWGISPLFSPCCRFRPSCSEYFIESIRKKGLCRGGMLGFWRLLRCQPFHSGGFDPVE